MEGASQSHENVVPYPRLTLVYVFGHVIGHVTAPPRASIKAAHPSFSPVSSAADSFIYHSCSSLAVWIRI